jgi:hypothetical protein
MKTMSFRRCCLWFSGVLAFGVGGQTFAAWLSGIEYARGYPWLMAGMTLQIACYVWYECAWKEARVPQPPNLHIIRRLRNFLWARSHRCRQRVLVLPQTGEALGYAEKVLGPMCDAKPCRVCGSMLCRNAFPAGVNVPRVVEVEIGDEFVRVTPRP